MDERQRGRIISHMWAWILIAALYVLGIGFFRWLGGIGAAADAIQRWGQTTAERRRPTSSG
jgi:hypothetical protein